jgi:hypothetical protein
MVTKDSLGIMFPAQKDGQEETSGFYCYAAYPLDKVAKSELVLSEINQEDYEQKWNLFEYDDHKVSSFAIHIINWPTSEEWPYFLNSICSELLKDGAFVLWFGDHSSAPAITSLDPKLADSNVYAACSKKSGLILGSDLNKPFKYLNDEQLAKVKFDI